MRVMIVGTRTYRGVETIRQRLVQLQKSADLLVITGTRRRKSKPGEPERPQIGADRIAHDQCLKLGIPVQVVDAQWDKFGAAAGPLRNSAMIDLAPELVIAYWNGESTGTWDTIQKAQRKKIPVEIHGTS